MSNSWIDQPDEIRKGEEIDAVLLRAFLAEHMELRNESISIKQFAKGFSNLTYLISDGPKEYVLRKPPIGAKIKSGHDMHREFRILKALHGSYHRCPEPIIYCGDESVIGSSFYVMERVEGIILRANMPNEMIPSEKQMKEISLSFVDTFVELHKVNYESIGLGELGRPEGYVARQVNGWTSRYNTAKTEEIEAWDIISHWLSDNLPVVNGASLIHNDFKYDNLVLDVSDWTKVKAVLDWEMATIGDPLMDLGTTLGYWINHSDPDWMKSLALNPTTLPGNPSREELVMLYFKRRGMKKVDMSFYYIFGLFKIAGISQQIYKRYKKGHTKDPRFARLNEVVKALGGVALQVLERGKLDV